MSLPNERTEYPHCFNCVFHTPVSPSKQSSAETKKTLDYCPRRNIILTLSNLPPNCVYARSEN